MYFSPGSGDSLLPIVGAPENCGYEVDPLKNTLTVPLNGCNVERHVSCLRVSPLTVLLNRKSLNFILQFYYRPMASVCSSCTPIHLVRNEYRPHLATSLIQTCCHVQVVGPWCVLNWSEIQKRWFHQQCYQFLLYHNQDCPNQHSLNHHQH